MASLFPQRWSTVPLSLGLLMCKSFIIAAKMSLLTFSSALGRPQRVPECLQRYAAPAEVQQGYQLHVHIHGTSLEAKVVVTPLMILTVSA